jgi:hypothetical protein
MMSTQDLEATGMPKAFWKKLGEFRRVWRQGAVEQAMRENYFPHFGQQLSVGSIIQTMA